MEKELLLANRMKNMPRRVPLLIMFVFLLSGCGVNEDATRAKSSNIENSKDQGQAHQESNDISISSMATQPRITTLEDRRPLIQFPDYSSHEKQLVAEQAEIYLRDLYVNRFQKKAFYGNHVDAVPRIAKVVDEAIHLSSWELNRRIQDIFKSQRDKHLNYGFPRPFSCFASFLPFDLLDVLNQQAASNASLLVVSYVFYSYQIFAPELASISVGDTLVSYNGFLPDQAIEQNIISGSGANLSAGKKCAIQQMTFLYHSFDLLPDEDEVELVFRRPDDSTYQVTIPWISYADNNCYAQSNPKMLSDSLFQVDDATGMSFDEYEIQFNKIKGHNALNTPLSARINLTQGVDPIVSFGRFSNNHGTFGYVKLTSFIPASADIGTFLFGFQDMLEDLDADTDGLIVDVRSNGGGYGILSDLMPQMFSDTEIDIIGFRLLASQLSKDVTANYSSKWYQLVDEALSNNKRFTKTALTTPPEYLQFFHRAYHHPVAVLTNASCYSACDMFAASMQDNKLAKIWGENNKTGAGGASVVDSDFFLSLNLPVFQPLPYGQSIRVSWHQAIRLGDNNGLLIEDWGVVRDESAIKTYEDIIDSDASILRRITSDLAWLAYDFEDE